MHPYTQNYQYIYVDNANQLAELCEHYRSQPVLAIDTEFVRTQTLTPCLGLIQVFDGKQVALIDPIAITDLSKFADILINESIVKVAHSCSEDLETLWQHLDIIPKPVFDTQVAAAMLDIGPSIGYANLIENLFSITIDKGESRTDWLQRPLSEAQCNYASADVTHLMAIYENLLVPITEHGFLPYIYDEIQALGVKKSIAMPSDLAYLQLKNNWKLHGVKLQALKLLAQWRLDEARRLNKSINFIIKEVALFELAYKLPVTQQLLFDCHNLYAKQARLYGDQLLNIIRQAKATPIEACPPPIQRLIEFKGYKPCAQLLKELIEQISEEQRIPQACLASKKQLNQLLKWCWFNFDELENLGLLPDVLSGFRRDLFYPHVNENSLIGKKIAENHEIMRSL